MATQKRTSKKAARKPAAKSARKKPAKKKPINWTTVRRAKIIEEGGKQLATLIHAPAHDALKKIQAATEESQGELIERLLLADAAARNL